MVQHRCSDPFILSFINACPKTGSCGANNGGQEYYDFHITTDGANILCSSARFAEQMCDVPSGLLSQQTGSLDTLSNEFQEFAVVTMPKAQ